MAGVAVTCSNAQFCQNGANPSKCGWNRKFALQCGATETGVATIRVATNSMPDHCIVSSASLPREGLIDFKVIFDKQTGLSYQPIKSSLSANNFRCYDSWVLDDAIKGIYNYKSYSWDNYDDIESIVGVAFNGVPIH